VTAFGDDAAFTHRAGLGDGAWVVDMAGAPTVVASLTSGPAAEAARVAGMLGVGPRVVRAGEGWIATEHLTAAHLTPLELRRPSVCRQAVELLARWHDTPMSRFELALPLADLPASLRAYVGAVDGSAADLPASLRDAVASAEQALAQLSRPALLVPCHLDVMANLVQTPSGLRLLDFDFAAVATPAQELGQLIWEGELDRRGAVELLGRYGSATRGEAPQVAETATWCVATGVTWTVWAGCQPGSTMARCARRHWERVRSHWAWSEVAACG
jgi:thiamine kinase-like enzyme